MSSESLKGRLYSRADEIGLEMITTAIISNEFSRESPKFQIRFHRSKRESVDRKSGQFGDLNIFKIDRLRERSYISSS